MIPALLALLADPTAQLVLTAIGSIVLHKYVPILEPLLNKLPQPGGPSNSDLLTKIIALEDKLHTFLSGLPTPKV